MPIQPTAIPTEIYPATSFIDSSPRTDTASDVANYTSSSAASAETPSDSGRRPGTPFPFFREPILPSRPHRHSHPYRSYKMSRTQHKGLTAEDKKKAIEQWGEKIQYSPRYCDDHWEYRHVILPKQLVRFVPQGVLVEDVWRGLGIRQSPGWEMYMRHDPEPHVLLFRRTKGYEQLHPPAFANPTAAPLVNPIAGGRQ